MPHSYPSYDHLMKEDADIRIEPVDQGEQFKEKEGFGDGICAGLANYHLLLQLPTEIGAHNPFKNNDAFQVSANIQNSCEHKGIKCYQEVLEKDSSLTTKSINVTDDIALEKNLKETVQKTLADGKARGSLAYEAVHRNPYNGKSLNGEHVISMTAQKHDDKLLCTGLDSNLFFTHGIGLSACEKIADKLVETTKAYAASSPITIIETTAGTAKEEKEEPLNSFFFRSFKL